MRSRRTPCRAWRFLLFAGLLLQAPLVAGQQPPIPPAAHLTPDVRSRLAEAARDETLEPWQREFMVAAAGHQADSRATQPSPALPGVVLRSDLVAADDAIWRVLAPGSPPSARQGHTAIYDPVRDRMVVFGGQGTSGFRNDVWALWLAGSPTWSALTPSGSLPVGRSWHTAFYDPVRDRMVMFGGWDGTSRHNDVWALSLAGSTAWSELAPAGSPPPGRSWHTAMYDPIRDRMVVFGGTDGGFRDDVWALSLSGSTAWSELAPAGSPPSARVGHAAFYDPVRDRMVVFGGHDGSLRNDTWALSLAGSPAWSALTPAGSPPSARYQHTAIYDPVRDRMVVFGGWAYGYTNDVWALSLAGSTAWSALAPAGSRPAERELHTAFYDSVRARMLVFGGWDGSSYRNDLWALMVTGGPAWSTFAPVGSPPSERSGHGAIYDPVRDRMVVFGGWDGSSYYNEVWELSLAGSPAWSQLAPAGSPPSARSGPTAIYDPVSDRMVVFGGFDGSFHNDVWELSLAGSPAWGELAPAGSPPAGRYWPTAIHDPVSDRMVVFGGYDGSSNLPSNEVWALSLAGSLAWSALAPTGSPPSKRYLHTAIYDAGNGRMVVFGGYDEGSLYNDVWALSLAGSPAWSELAPTGSPPAVRYAHTACYDPVRNHMVVFGGHDGNFCNDAWALSLAGSPTWSELAPAGSPPPARNGHAAFFDPVRDRMVVFGGQGTSGFRNDVWALEWAPPLSVHGDEHAGPRLFELAPAWPNPSRGATTLEFELREPARVVLDVFDVHGRRAKRISDGWLPAGRHVSTWRGDDEAGHMLGSGVYFISMQGGGFRATRCTVRVR